MHTLAIAGDPEDSISNQYLEPTLEPLTWAAALPSYKQAALRLHLQHPSKPPAALINSVYAADPSMPSAFSGGALKTFLQSPEALAWIAAQAQQEAA